MRQLLTFLHPVLRSLDEGNPIRTGASRVLRALAVVTLLLGVFAVVQALKTSFRFDSTPATLAGIVFTAILAAGVLAVAETMLYRADTVAKLGPSSFTVIPIVSVLLRLAGEVYALLGLALAAGGCAFTWLAGISPREVFSGFGSFLPIPSMGGSFLGGLILLGIGSGVSFLLLILAYFLAESSLVLVDIARNIHALSLQLKVPRVGAEGQPRGVTCPKCGAPNPGAAQGEFCSECGTRL